MSSTALLSRDQRVLLAKLMQARLREMKCERASQLHNQSQADSARQTLLQDADDARQRAGEHEVEDIVGDIDSREFNAISEALHRVHRADYGTCVECHEAIPFERLQLEPQALRCAACQALQERHRAT
jgi:RNA polymerase-binding transcription factor DksA